MSKKIQVKAKIYVVGSGKTANRMYANVQIGDIMHINSYVVGTISDDPYKITCFPPSRYDKRSEQMKPFIEFANPKDNPLVEAIRKACISAYKLNEEKRHLQTYGEAFEVDLDDLSTLTQKVASNGNNTDFIPCEAGDEILELKEIPF